MASAGKFDLTTFQHKPQIGRINRSHLDVPKVLSSPWLRIKLYIRILFLIVPEDLSRVPLKLPYKIPIHQMVEDPIPEWAALSLVCYLKITRDFMAFELGSKFNMVHDIYNFRT